MHIISLVVCYLAIVIVFLMFMHGAKKLRIEKERELCMMNHPADKRAPTEPSLIGGTMMLGRVTIFDPPIMFEKPTDLEGD